MRAANKKPTVQNTLPDPITAAVDALLCAEPSLGEHFNKGELRERLRVWLMRLAIAGRVERQEREG